MRQGFLELFQTEQASQVPSGQQAASCHCPLHNMAASCDFVSAFNVQESCGIEMTAPRLPRTTAWRGDWSATSMASKCAVSVHECQHMLEGVFNWQQCTPRADAASSGSSVAAEMLMAMIQFPASWFAFKTSRYNLRLAAQAT